MTYRGPRASVASFAKGGRAMRRSIHVQLAAWSLAMLALRGLAAAQGQTTDRPKPETQLRIVVTGDNPAGPVKSADVYVEWKEDDETKSREGTTNGEGKAGPYKVPRATVFVQVTTKDNAWERYGADHELTEEQQTINVTLRKKSG
jgi:hypothetical protein